MALARLDQVFKTVVVASLHLAVGAVNLALQSVDHIALTCELCMCVAYLTYLPSHLRDWRRRLPEILGATVVLGAIGYSRSNNHAAAGVGIGLFGTYYTVCICAPDVEEDVKLRHPAFAWIITAYESVRRRESLGASAIRLAFHNATTWMPTRAAKLVHKAWNFGVLAYGVHNAVVKTLVYNTGEGDLVIEYAQMAARFGALKTVSKSRPMITAAAVATTAALGLYFYEDIVEWAETARARARARLLESCRVYGVEATRFIREMIADIPIYDEQIDPTHPHGQAAAPRKALANRVIRVAKAITGRPPFSVQMSERDVRAGVPGNCYPYNGAKDTTVRLCDDEPEPGQVIALNDVAQFITPERLALWGSRGHIITGYLPIKTLCAGYEHDVAHTYDENNVLWYMVNGGATYKGHAWDFHHDVITVKCGAFKHRTVSFKVEFGTYRHHTFFTLIPTANVPLWGGSIFFDPGEELTYFKPCVKPGVLLTRAYGRSGPTISIGIPMHFSSVTMSATSYERARIMLQHYPKMTSQSLSTTFELGVAESAQLIAHLRAVGDVPPCDTHTNKLIVVERRLADEPFDIEPVKPCVRQFAMTPVSVAAPTNSRANETFAIVERVQKPSTWDECRHELDPGLLRLVDTFVGLLPADRLVPCTVCEVLERQTRPAQQAKNEAACWMSWVDRLFAQCKAFLKAERIDPLKPPRVVTTDDDRAKIELARFVYPLMDYLCKLPWFAPGKTAEEIADRVYSIIARKRKFNAGDFSKQDATEALLARVLGQALGAKLFSHTDYVLFCVALRRVCSARVASFWGIMYWIFLQMASGRMTTTEENTVLSAFVAWVSYVLEGFSFQEAYDLIGIHGGDDSFDSSDPQYLVQAAYMCGARMTCERVPVFLNRYFTLNEQSHCSILRALSSYGVTTRPFETDAERLALLVEKFTGYMQHDRNTPLIGDIGKAVFHVARLAGVQSAPVQPGWRIEGAWPNEICELDAKKSLSELDEIGFDYTQFGTWIESIMACGPGDEVLATQLVLNAPMCANQPVPPVPPGTCLNLDGYSVWDPQNPPKLIVPIADKPGRYELVDGVVAPPHRGLFERILERAPRHPGRCAAKAIEKPEASLESCDSTGTSASLHLPDVASESPGTASSDDSSDGSDDDADDKVVERRPARGKVVVHPPETWVEGAHIRRSERRAAIKAALRQLELSEETHYTTVDGAFRHGRSVTVVKGVVRCFKDDA